MPPSSNPAQFNPTDLPAPAGANAGGQAGHLLARPKPFGEGGLPPAPKSSAGPVIGIIIIVILLVVGALYFWGAHLNAQNPEDQLPLIPGDPSATIE